MVPCGQYVMVIIDFSGQNERELKYRSALRETTYWFRLATGVLFTASAPADETPCACNAILICSLRRREKWTSTYQQPQIPGFLNPQVPVRT